LHGWAPGVLPSIASSQNETDDAIGKRASSTFWLANIEQNGQSPFAPVGYKVWRNVLDYGATGVMGPSISVMFSATDMFHRQWCLRRYCSNQRSYLRRRKMRRELRL
jgi:hypothetical protein